MTSPLDELLYPPFTGFPPEAMHFLRKLKKNNNRPWFTKHKEEYQENVHMPMECLIATVGEQMRDVAPDFEFHPRKSIFRIYRDVRFSNDKSPYKTNIAASFQFRKRSSPTESPGLYIGIEPGEIFIGGGLYMPMGPQLKAIRKAVAEDPESFLEIVGSREFKKSLGSIMGERLSRAPLGYPVDHPMIEYLKFRQWFVGVELKDDKVCGSARFAKTVTKVFTAAMPFVRWLASVAG
jgi:uncharacterized protein (TIGR02453 family)